MSKTYIRVEREKIPLTAAGESLIDLFVLLPTENKYLRFVAKGNTLDPQRMARLDTHVSPDLWADEQEFKRATVKGAELIYGQKAKLKVGELTEEQVEVLSKEAEERIRDITQALLAVPAQDPQKTLRELELVTEEIITLVAPEAKIIKKHLLQFTQHLELMNNASAITTLAVIVAVANGFDSTKSFKELSFASLIMDIGMSELLEEDQEQYYRNASMLSPKAKEIVRNHPARSHQLAIEKLPSLSETTLQLILTHHEIYNGKGYPRGIRTESLAPIMKVLPLAVDVFEYMKRNHLEETPATLKEAFNYFLKEDCEAHARRHSKKLCENCVKYLSEADSEEENPNPAKKSA